MATSSNNNSEDAGAPKPHRREIVDQRVIKALGHPVRAEALSILNERVASPTEIAGQLEQEVGHVSYHINVLKKCGCIELVRTTPRRGAVEHFYRAVSPAVIDDEEWARLPASLRPAMTVTVLQTLIGDAAAALGAGTFENRASRHLAWTPMVTDERGWAELSDAARQLLERVLEIQRASAERLAESQEPGIPVSVASMVYETPLGDQLRPRSQEAA